MELEIIAFGIVKDILGSASVTVTADEGQTTGSLKELLEQQYPKLKELTSLMIAVNNEYAKSGDTLHEADEIALIPPVSGG